MDKGFYKVDQSGGSYVVAKFWNPETREVRSECVRDYDYADGSRDNDELYMMPIDEEMRRRYFRSIGLFSEGDLVRVVKGRKVPIGTTGKVVRIFDANDKYGRWVARYAELDCSVAVNVANVALAD